MRQRTSTKEEGVFEEPGDRGRMVLAAVVTVVALPFLWSAKRDSPNESVAIIGPAGAVTKEMPATGMDAPNAAELIGPISLVDPLGATEGTTVDDGTVVIDVAAPATGSSVAGMASYRRWPKEQRGGAEMPCGTTLAPYGTHLVVTNNDNGYNVACTNVSSRPLPDGTVIQLDTDVMLRIASLTDSPVPVTVSW